MMSRSEPSILVTGGAGRLGREVVRILAAYGRKIKVFDLPEPLSAVTLDGVERIAGDLSNPDDIRRAVKSVGTVIHLAALLPPVSEEQPSVTRKVNVEGTRTLISELLPDIHVIFASSVATYGVPQRIPVTVDHPQKPINVYGETKKEAEKIIQVATDLWTVLRIAPVAIPVVQDLPEPWPFTRGQKVEFVSIYDVGHAVVGAVGNHKALNRTFNIAGGASWQVEGSVYSDKICRILELDPMWASFRETVGWAGWYDTSASQALLNYQRTTFEDHLTELAAQYKALIES